MVRIERGELADVILGLSRNGAEMSSPLIVEFTKMTGAGNDFMVIDNRFYRFSDQELSAIALRLCRRRHGVGADGVLAFAEAEAEGFDFQMRYINADGSLGTMCANGARCLARYAKRSGLVGPRLAFETDSGCYEALVPAEAGADVRLFMRPPGTWKPYLALAGKAPAPLADIHYVWTGTEHVVCFVESVQSAPVTRWGPVIRYDGALAPEGANVNFVEVVSEVALRVRTYEKGVEDETLACGTGAVASAVAARRLARIRPDTATRIDMPGGILHVGPTAERIALDGPATTVFRGTFELES